MRKIAGTVAALALMLAPITSSAGHGPEHTVGDTTVGVEDGQGCLAVYVIKADQGYQVFAIGGYGLQRKEGEPGSAYHPHSSDPRDPDQSICPSDHEEPETSDE